MRLSLPVLFFSLAACNGSDTDSADPSLGDNPDGDPIEAVCTDPTPVSCVDDLILDLSLQDDESSEGAVDNAVDGDGFLTTVDASAGGFSAATNNPWVYIRFTDDGAERVDIDDETALESMDWDMAMRRFIVRLNGGASGPSCVGAVSFLESSYEDLDTVPDGLTFRQDDFYTDDCTIINDSSGLPGSPQVVLGTWWEYPGCVATTGTPHLIQLANGRILKLVLDSYYAQGQESCNASGQPGEGGGNLSMRWAWMN
ncbi:MAG: HmuY family protein [Myxococcota bacterium]